VHIAEPEQQPEGVQVGERASSSQGATTQNKREVPSLEREGSGFLMTKKCNQLLPLQIQKMRITILTCIHHLHHLL
jgi:hypothetical protein